MHFLIIFAKVTICYIQYTGSGENMVKKTMDTGQIGSEDISGEPFACIVLCYILDNIDYVQCALTNPSPCILQHYRTSLLEAEPL